jgi:hypothetical protein
MVKLISFYKKLPGMGEMTRTAKNYRDCKNYQLHKKITRTGKKLHGRKKITGTAKNLKGLQKIIRTAESYQDRKKLPGPSKINRT